MKQKEMRLIKQKESWSCGVNAWATVLRKDKEEILKMIPRKIRLINEYSEEFPELPAPGIPMSIFVPIAHKLKKAVALHFLTGLSAHQIRTILNNKEGVIVHEISPKFLHAVAWDGEKILDSSQGIRNFQDLVEDEEVIEQFYEVYQL